MLPRLQTRCLLTKRDIPKLFFIKALFRSLVQPLPGCFHYVFFAVSREVRSELSQCVQIGRPGSSFSFYVEVRASLSMIKSVGGVEAGSFMLVILELWVRTMFTNSSIVILFLYRRKIWILVLFYFSVLSPPQGSIAERAIPVLFIQLAFLRGTQILFVRAPGYFSFWKVRWDLKAFSIKMPIYKALSWRGNKSHREMISGGKIQIRISSGMEDLPSTDYKTAA